MPLPLDWAASAIGAGLDSVEDIAVTPYSHVARLRAAGKTYYLKKTPPALFIEAKILQLLSVDCAGMIPALVAEDAATRCFILQPCGDETLRSFFKNGFNSETFLKSITVSTAIQKSTVPRLADFESAGVADWRLARLPVLLEELLADEGTCRKWEIDVAALGGSIALLRQLCDALAAYNIPDALNHSDLQDNNMVIDHASGHVAIIDWGEVTIGNPLLPLVACASKAAGRYGLAPDSQGFADLQRCVLGGWDVPENEHGRAWSIATPLADIYYVFTLLELIKRSEGDFPGWGPRIRDGFARFLQNALKAQL